MENELFKSIESENIEQVKELLKKRCNINYIKDEIYTPLLNV